MALGREFTFMALRISSLASAITPWYHGNTHTKTANKIAGILHTTKVTIIVYKQRSKYVFQTEGFRIGKSILCSPVDEIDVIKL
jgi:hypothetical protein